MANFPVSNLQRIHNLDLGYSKFPYAQATRPTLF